MSNKRGINLGCGRVILPCERPEHHKLLPGELYTSPDIEWDNVDLVAGPGVDMQIDLFAVPWESEAGGIPDNTYDVALATHLVEHIPHYVKEHGRIAKTHGGWWAWWDELSRVLKPGGIVYVLVPYGFSRGGIMDPTHTRYILPETFGYFVPDENAPFDYALKSRWGAGYGPLMGFTPMAYTLAARDYPGEPDRDRALFNVAQVYNNMISEFAIGIRVIKDATVSDE